MGDTMNQLLAGGPGLIPLDRHPEWRQLVSAVEAPDGIRHLREVIENASELRGGWGLLSVPNAIENDPAVVAALGDPLRRINILRELRRLYAAMDGRGDVVRSVIGWMAGTGPVAKAFRDAILWQRRRLDDDTLPPTWETKRRVLDALIEVAALGPRSLWDPLDVEVERREDGAPWIPPVQHGRAPSDGSDYGSGWWTVEVSS